MIGQQELGTQGLTGRPVMALSTEEKAWLLHCNEQALVHIERQGRTVRGLVPFVGAGLSTAFGFSDWLHLLLDNAPPAQRPV